MGIIESQLVFAQSQSYTTFATAGSSYASTNVYRRSAIAASGSVVAGAGQSASLGSGQQLYGHLLVTTLMTQASTNGTNEIRFVSSASPTITSTPTIHWSSGVYTDWVNAAGVGALRQPGDVVDFAIPEGTYLEYIGFIFVVATQNNDGGAISIWIDRNAGKVSPPTIYASGHNFA